MLESVGEARRRQCRGAAQRPCGLWLLWVPKTARPPAHTAHHRSWQVEGCARLEPDQTAVHWQSLSSPVFWAPSRLQEQRTRHEWCDPRVLTSEKLGAFGLAQQGTAAPEAVPSTTAAAMPVQLAVPPIDTTSLLPALTTSPPNCSPKLPSCLTQARRSSFDSKCSCCHCLLQCPVASPSHPDTAPAPTTISTNIVALPTSCWGAGKHLQERVQSL